MSKGLFLETQIAKDRKRTEEEEYVFWLCQIQEGKVKEVKKKNKKS